MEWGIILIVLVAIWFIFQYRKLKYLAKVIEAMETRYIEDIKDNIKRRVGNPAEEPLSEQVFKEIYKVHIDNLLEKSQKFRDEFEFKNLSKEKIDIYIPKDSGWNNYYFVLQYDRKILKDEIILEYDKNKCQQLKLSGNVVGFIGVVSYLSSLKEDIFDMNDREELLRNILEALYKEVVDFKEYWMHRKTRHLVGILEKNFKEDETPYLKRILKLLKNSGEHRYSSYEEVKLFTCKEIDTIKNKIDNYCLREILRHDFKYIGQLKTIIDDLEKEYGLIDHAMSGGLFLMSGKYNVRALEAIKNEIYTTGLSLTIISDRLSKE